MNILVRVLLFVFYLSMFFGSFINAFVEASVALISISYDSELISFCRYKVFIIIYIETYLRNIYF